MGDEKELLLWKKKLGEKQISQREQPSFEWLNSDEEAIVRDVVQTLNARQVVHLLATLSGLKRGTIVTDRFESENATPQGMSSLREQGCLEIWDSMTQLGIPSIVQVTRRPSLGSIFVSVYVSRSIEGIQQVPPFYLVDKTIQEIEARFNQQWGDFLGIPDEDNCWYQEPELSSVDRDVPVADAADVELSPVEEFFACLVPYGPRPTEEGVFRSVAVGREYANAVYTFGGEELLSWVVEENLFRLEMDDQITSKRRTVTVDTISSAL